MLTNIQQLLIPEPNAIPAEMKAAKRWLGFKVVPRPKPNGAVELAKEPRQGAQPSCKASSTNEATWCDFNTAYTAVQTGALDGLGFALGDGWAGVDLDNAVMDGELTAKASEVVADFRSYTEFSVSGTGVHILVRGEVPAGKRSGDIEVYGAGRYFTVSGHALPFCPATVEPRQEELDTLVTQIDAGRSCSRQGNGAVAVNPSWPEHPPAPPATKAEIIERGRRICRGFDALWQGEIDIYDGDASRADMALIGSLAWLCGPGQQALVLDIAMQSGLRREKWSRHQTYLKRTIDEAYRNRGPDDFYNWPRREPTPEIVPLSLPGGTNDEGGIDLRLRVTIDDIGFARRLAKDASPRIRYVSKWGKCLYWDGRRWAMDDGACLTQAAQKLRDQLWLEYAELPSEQKTKEPLQFIQACGSANRIQNIVQLTKRQQPIRISHEQLDRHPYLLNVRNGTIDLKTGELLPHNPAHLITQLAAVDFDPNATSTDWDSFVSQCMQEDADLVDFIQVAAGLALSGDVSPQLLWCHYGSGANGKSTFLGALSAMLGDYAMPAPPNFLMMKSGDSHPTETAMLYGKRLVTAIECEGGQRLRESYVKMLTGGDPVSARRMKEDFWSMNPTWQIHVSFNDPPTINGTDDGIRRRLKIIPWQARFEGESRDPTLKARLESEEHRSAILNWCLAGMRRYLENGIPATSAVAKATDEYVTEQDVLGNFLRECCRVDELNETGFNDFMSALHEWLDKRGENARSWSAKRLAAELKRRGFKSGRSNAIGSRGKTFYRGLSLILPRQSSF